MSATSVESNDQDDGSRREPAGVPRRYAHIRYGDPDSSGRYREASALVGTLEYIAEHYTSPHALPYMFELFGGQNVVTMKDGRLSVTSGNGLFEVCDLEHVTQTIPGIAVVLAIDEYEFSTEEMKKIEQGTYAKEDEHLWDAHEILKEKQIGEMGVVALVRGPIPYCEDLVRAFLKDNGLLGTSSDKSIKYTLTLLGDDSEVFEQSLVADDAVCLVHNIGDDPLLPSEEYWVPVGEWQAA